MARLVMFQDITANLITAEQLGTGDLPFLNAPADSRVLFWDGAQISSMDVGTGLEVALVGGVPTLRNTAAALQLGWTDPDGVTQHLATYPALYFLENQFFRWDARDDISGIEGSLAVKMEARAPYSLKAHVNALGASLANLASPSGTAGSVDGMAYAAGKTVLLLNQTTGHQNRPWQIESGAWTFPSWFATGQVVQPGFTIQVDEGDTWKTTQWVLQGTGPLTVGTDTLNWARVDGRTVVFSEPGTALNLGNAPYKWAAPNLAIIFAGIGAGGIAVTLPPIAGQWLGGVITVKDRANIAATRNVTLNASVGQQVDGGTSTTLNTNRGRVQLLGGPVTAAGGVVEWSIITRV